MQVNLRKIAAAHVRDVRAMWPELKGDWTRREWNRQARAAGRALLYRLDHLNRVNK